MDSLKVPKGSSSSSSSPKSSSSSNVPVAVRFNAGEECIDDIFKINHNNGLGKSNSPSPSVGNTDVDNIEISRSDKENLYADSVHSLSSSPSQSLQQNNDDTNIKNNFLQGNFFNRKRSDSIEGISPTSAGPNLISGLGSGSETTSGGTWKLIKGKVSQTFDEIKSSKQAQQQQVLTNKIGLEMDSEEEKSTFMSKRHSDEQQHKIDSESEFEHDFLLDTEVESSRLRRGLANLKSKVKSKQQQNLQQATESQQPQQQAVMYTASSNTVKTVKKDKSPVRASGSQPSSSGSSLRNALLGRKRKPQSQELASPTTTTTTTFSSTLGLRKRSGIQMGKKNMEIETGVEMLEDTIPIAERSKTDSATAVDLNLPLKSEAQSRLAAGESPIASSIEAQARLSMEGEDLHRESSAKTYTAEKINAFTLKFKKFPYLIIICIFVVLWLPMEDFIRGVIICLLGIALCDAFSKFAEELIEYLLVSTPPEKVKFEIPDYSKLPIVEIPAAEEHKTVKTYAGWMNEATAYDPNTFHISMTKSVYIRLEGSILHMFSTQARIPKRAMWNEIPIDRNSINFTEKRSFNLLGCRIELLPLGLARKRYFNRKYPLQLIVKKCVDRLSPQPSSKRPSTASKDEPIFADAQSISNYSTLTQTNGNTGNADDAEEENSDIDFATTIMNTDLGAWQESINPDIDLHDMTIPCGDETRLLLFSRADREKEDWYRRFMAASLGEVHDKELNLSNIRLVDDKELQAAAEKNSIYQQKSKDDDTQSNLSARDSNGTQREQFVSVAKTPDEDFEELDEDLDFELQTGQSIEGLLMTWCAARNPAEYLRFMALYQKSCNQTQIPVYKKSEMHFDKHHHNRHQRRIQRKKDELWKGIDQSLFLGPSGSVVWANVLLGRLIFSCLHDPIILAKVQDLLQKKLASVRLPSFMEDVVITQINLGKTPPLIHRVSQPMLDERGVWVDADVTYEGLLQITVTTKLNLLRLKKQARPTGPFVELGGLNVPSGGATLAAGSILAADTPNSSNWFPANAEDNTSNDPIAVDDNTHSAIYDSDAESSGGSSSETDSAGGTATNADTASADFNVFNSTSPGNARRIFKIVDRITASNFFQYATELSYVQRAMENMNANITLRIDLKGLVARAVLNIPPPPSDRVWLSFRGPPRLWVTAKPAVGDKSMDWSIVTNVIESKLCELVNKHLVYPNMVDFTIPLLGSPNYNNNNNNNHNKYNPE